MKTRTILTLLVSSFFTAPFAAALGNPSACDAATEALDGAFHESGGAITREVALRIRDAVEACPAQAPAPEPATLPTEGPGDRLVGEVRLIAANGIFAEACGFTAPVTGESPTPAPITVWMQAVVYSTPDYDEGIASITYDPATTAATYDVTGEEWGLFASSLNGVSTGGSGYISLYGIPIPATAATATTGCTASNPSLCWGMGTAKVVLPPNTVNVAAITASSAFYGC